MTGPTVKAPLKRFKWKIQFFKKSSWKLEHTLTVIGILINVALIVPAIITLNDTKHQFTIANQPYLQIDKPTFVELVINKPVEIKYTLKNFGNLPAVITNAYTGITWCRPSDIPEYKANSLKYMKLENLPDEGSRIVAKESSDTAVSTFGKATLDTNQMCALYEGKMIGIFYGRFKYTSNAFRKTHEYLFMVRLVVKVDTTIKRWIGLYEILYNMDNEL